ncbi:unnamed protein product [Lepeophtheirus salmonis]|uniref:(salmon louse) hypothetical protein n=1 Tax=Lepeophtheirus salmonis TaxID=72036 RepID=A0A7R8D071_LEPSM|nr:huntingtin-interacting protein K-like [Lepeophtheirus salmonis]CAB4065382.1 unnamed protein product [Lepeophtheirus salmonis]CAF2956548.1 unnamed protein product [Lepeophtheirus salmonis]
MGDDNDMDRSPASTDTKNKEKKHDSGIADLEKVTDYAEEKEILSSTVELEDAIRAIRNKREIEASEKLVREKELAKVEIKKEDVELIMNELEICKSRAERVLREKNGDAVAALTVLTN